MYYPPILIAAFSGGVLRGLVGFIKHQYAYKSVKFDLSYFLTMAFISGAIGLMVGAAVKELNIHFFGAAYFNAPIAFIVGYSGGDFLENLYKIIIKKPLSKG